MSVLSIAQDILIIVKAVQMIVVEIKGNKNKAQRLVTRINTIIPTIYMITQDPSKVVCTVERLQDLLSYIQGIKAFIEKFNKTSYFGKAWNIGSDNLAFAEFNDGLGVRIEALQFNIQVSAEKQRQEDQQDAEADADEMKEMLQKVLESQGMMQAEIDNHLNNMMIQNQQMYVDTKNAIIQGNAEIMKALNSLQNGQFSSLPAVRTIAPEQLEYIEDDSSLLGQGSFGAIYEGTYLGLEVAIKTIKNSNITRAMKEELQKEALTMQMLDFPGIIHFYGANLESAPRFIVMEKALCSLFDLLYQPEKYTPDVDFNLYARLDLLGDIARSIEYIHSVSIIHGDIKSHNILLSAELKPKITDFGLAKGKGTSTEVCSTINADGTFDFKGSPAYLAPEIFLESNYSKYSDVYSFAVVMNEVLTRTVPFDQVSAQDIMYRTVTAKTRPAMFNMEHLTSCCPAGFALDPNVMLDSQSLITRCWSELPNQRPLFHIVSKSIERIAGTIRGGGGMESLDGGSSKNNTNGKSFTNGSRTKSNVDQVVDAAKDAVFKELQSWLVSKVELFPDQAAQIAKALVGAGVTGMKKLDARIRKIPKFLDSLGVDEFAAADIKTALEKEFAESSHSEPATPARPKRVSQADASSSSNNRNGNGAKNDPQYERRLMIRARECTGTAAISDVLNEIMQIEPLTSISKDTLGEVFKVVANLGYNSIVNQTDLGQLGACTIVGSLLYAYHEGLEAASQSRSGMSNYDSTVLESGLWCITVLAMNNAANQKILGEVGVPALIVALLNRHGSTNPAVAEQALRAIENLTLEAENREKFGAKGVCQVLTTMLGMYCSVNNAIVEHCLAAISNLCRGSRLNQDNFMRCGVLPPLMNVIVVLAPSMVTIADYAMFTIKSLCTDNFDAVMAFAGFDVVNNIIQLLFTHGSHSITVTESGIGALAVLCCQPMIPSPQQQQQQAPPQPNPHMNVLYYNDQAVEMVLRAFKHLSVKSKTVTTWGMMLYGGLLAHMAQFSSSQYAPGIMMLNPKIASDAQLHDLTLLVVNGVKTHGVSHKTLAEQAILLLKQLALLAGKANLISVYSVFGEVNICAVVVDIMFTHRDSPQIAGHCIDMLIALTGITDNITRLTTGPNTNLYKFVMELIGVFHERKVCPLTLLEAGVRLYSILLSRIPSAEANQGDANGCKFLIALLASMMQQCFSPNSSIPLAGVTPIVVLQGGLQAVQVLTAYPANKAAFGELGGCQLICDIGRSFATDVGFSGRILEVLANLAMFNNNDPKLIQAGASKMIIDMLISFSYGSDVVTIHGLRAISNLAVANKLMLAELNICPIVCDILRYYISTNNPHHDQVACQCSVAIYNLCVRCRENRDRFAALNIEKDLQNVLNSHSKTLSQQSRDEIKAAINAIRFEQ